MARKFSLNSHLSKKSVPKVDRSSCLSSNAWIGKSPLDGDARVLYIHITCFIHWIQKIPSCCISSCLSCYGVDSLRYIHAFINHSLNQIARLECKSFQFNISHSYKQQVGLFFQFVPIKSICVRMNVEIMKRINIQLNSIWLKFSAFCDVFSSFPLYVCLNSFPSNICTVGAGTGKAFAYAVVHGMFVSYQSKAFLCFIVPIKMVSTCAHHARHACAHASVRWKER